MAPTDTDCKNAKAPGSRAFADLLYKPGKTLGRSGYVSDPADRLAERIRYLDALLCLVTAREGLEGGCEAGFGSVNDQIQRSVLDLASSLATEAHELHTVVELARAAPCP